MAKPPIPRDRIVWRQLPGGTARHAVYLLPGAGHGLVAVCGVYGAAVQWNPGEARECRTCADRLTAPEEAS